MMGMLHRYLLTIRAVRPDLEMGMMAAAPMSRAVVQVAWLMASVMLLEAGPASTARKRLR